MVIWAGSGSIGSPCSAASVCEEPVGGQRRRYVAWTGRAGTPWSPRNQLTACAVIFSTTYVPVTCATSGRCPQWLDGQLGFDDANNWSNVVTKVRDGAKDESSASATTITTSMAAPTSHSPSGSHVGCAPGWTYAEHGCSGHEFVGAFELGATTMGLHASASDSPPKAKAHPRSMANRPRPLL